MKDSLLCSPSPLLSAITTDYLIIHALFAALALSPGRERVCGARVRALRQFVRVINEFVRVELHSLGCTLSVALGCAFLPFRSHFALTHLASLLFNCTNLMANIGCSARLRTPRPSKRFLLSAIDSQLALGTLAADRLQQLVQTYAYAYVCCRCKPARNDKLRAESEIFCFRPSRARITCGSWAQVLERRSCTCYEWNS